MNVADRAISGVKWLAVARFSKQALQFATLIILANHLAPGDFGLMGMSMVVIGFMNILNDFGISAAIIQKSEVDRDLLSSTYWFNILLGISLMSLLFVSSPLIAAFYHDQRLSTILQALSFCFPLMSAGFIHQAFLEKNLLFRYPALAEITSSMIGSACAIYLAYMKAGVWALVFQTLSAVALNCLLLHVLSKFKPRLHFKWAEVKSLMYFSLNLSGFNFFNYFIRNADSILIGKYLGAVDLGYYTLAMKIILFPVQNISTIVSRVMYPAYVKIKNDNEEFKRVYILVSVAIAFVTFPVMAGIFSMRDLIVHLFLTPNWAPVSTLLMILAPIGLIQSLDTTTGSIFLAKGRTDWMFRWGFITGLFFLFAFYIGLSWGVHGVAMLYLLATIITQYPGFMIPFKLIGLNVREYLSQLVGTLFCALCLVSGVLISRHSFPSLFVGRGGLILLALIALAIYLFSSFVFNKKHLMFSAQIFRKTVKIG